MHTGEQLAFLFPGQGSQRSEMGGSFRETREAVRILYEMELESLMRVSHDIEGVQPALLAASLASVTVLHEEEVNPTIVAGHSFGMITACVAAGVYSPHDGFQIAAERERLMSRVPGKMAAIIGLSRDAVEEILSGTEVVVACHNSPLQTVISGKPDHIDQMLLKFGKRAIPLNVRIAGHHPDMSRIQKPFEEVLRCMPAAPPHVPVALDHCGVVTADEKEIQDGLIAHLTRPVEWVKVIQALVAHGAWMMIEAGPKRTLAPLAIAIDERIAAHTVSNEETLRETLKRIGRPETRRSE